MKNPITPSRTSSRGFTLIELLVAMAITTIIIGILVSVTSLALDTWNRSRSEIRAARQGKAMIDSMARDFESMVVRKGNNFEWLYAKFTPTDEGPKTTDNKSPNAADLVFFTAATDRYNGNIGPTFPDSKGDVSTVAYQLSYTDPIDSGATASDEYKTFVLYRKIINPDVTFTDTLGTQFTETGNDLLTKASNAASDSSVSGNDIDNTSNFICENVYQFTITFNVEITETDGTITSVPVQVGDNGSDIFKIGGQGLQMDTVPNGVDIDEVKAGRLTSVEVSLTILSDFGLKQMQKRTLADGKVKDDFIAENSFQYSKLIPVPGS